MGADLRVVVGAEGTPRKPRFRGDPDPYRADFAAGTPHPSRLRRATFPYAGKAKNGTLRLFFNKQMKPVFLSQRYKFTLLSTSKLSEHNKPSPRRGRWRGAPDEASPRQESLRLPRRRKPTQDRWRGAPDEASPPQKPLRLTEPQGATAPSPSSQTFSCQTF